MIYIKNKDRMKSGFIYIKMQINRIKTKGSGDIKYMILQKAAGYKKGLRKRPGALLFC